jgi:hypothetical protein
MAPAPRQSRMPAMAFVAELFATPRLIPMYISDFHGVVYFTLPPQRSGAKQLLI